MRGREEAACSKDPAPGCSHCFRGRGPVEGLRGRKAVGSPWVWIQGFAQRKGVWVSSVQGEESVKPLALPFFTGQGN